MSLTNWLCFGSGIGFSILIMFLLIIWANKKPDKYIPPPLNPELLKFWDKTIDQKEKELQLLEIIAGIHK